MSKETKNIQEEKKNQKTKTSTDNLYKLDGRVPLGKAIPFGMQHVLAMFVGNLVPMLLVSNVALLADGSKIADNPVFAAQLLQCAMLAAGLGTLIQLYPVWKIGSRLPIVMGTSFTFLATMITIVSNPSMGYPALIGAVIVGGCIIGFLGLTAKYWKHLISPIVSGCVVTAIGFSLLSVGMSSFGGDTNNPDFGAWYYLVVGTITLVACLLFKIFAKGIWQNLNVLIGLVVGYVVALIFTFTGVANIIDFTKLSKAVADLGIINIPYPVFFKDVIPTFHMEAIIPMLLIFLVSAAETIGDTTAVCESALKRDITEKEVSGSVAADGFGSALAGCFGSCPITSFAQNVGLIAMTKIVNRYTIATGAFFLILCSLVPPIGAFFNTLPPSVIGGCTIMMFGSIVYTGIQMIAKAGFTERNMTIVSLAFVLGIGSTLLQGFSAQLFSSFPALIGSIFSTSSVAGVFVVAMILDLVLPGREQSRRRSKQNSQANFEKAENAENLEEPANSEQAQKLEGSANTEKDGKLENPASSEKAAQVKQTE